MNTDFRLSVGYFEHPKIMKLERRLGEGAVLSHIRLLRFASMNKPDGVLNGMDAEDVANAAGYKGDADAFLSQLVSVRLLDDDGGNLSLHDWQEWNPWAAGSKERIAKAKSAASARWGGAVPKDAQSKPVANAPNATSTVEQCSEHDLALPLSYPILSESYPILSKSKSLPRSEPPTAARAARSKPACHVHPAVCLFQEGFVAVKGRSPAKNPVLEGRAAAIFEAQGEETYRRGLDGFFSCLDGADPYPKTKGFDLAVFVRQFDTWEGGSAPPAPRPRGSSAVDTSPEAKYDQTLRDITLPLSPRGLL